MSRVTIAFLALVVAQTAHSIEEYVGRLYDVFPPARFVTGLVSSDRELGFTVINVTIVTFGWWCFLWPVRKEWPVAVGLIWVWIAVELVNGIGHTAWSLSSGRYTPGVATAPALFVLASYLAYRMRSRSGPRPSFAGD
jgi:hypothetical protein